MNMLMMLKNKWHSLVSRFSSKSLSVKPGSLGGTRLGRMRKFITDKKYNLGIEYNLVIDTYDVKEKLKFIFGLCLNIIATGLAIQYCIENRDPISYGLTTLLILFYFEKIVLTIKQPIKKTEEK